MCSHCRRRCTSVQRLKLHSFPATDDDVTPGVTCFVDGAKTRVSWRSAAVQWQRTHSRLHRRRTDAQTCRAEVNLRYKASFITIIVFAYTISTKRWMHFFKTRAVFLALIKLISGADLRLLSSAFTWTPVYTARPQIRYWANASRGVPVNAPVFASTYCAYLYPVMPKPSWSGWLG